MSEHEDADAEANLIAALYRVDRLPQRSIRDRILHNSFQWHYRALGLKVSTIESPNDTKPSK